MLRHIEINGSAEYKTSMTEVGTRRSFSNQGTESELTLEAVIGMLDYYRRNQESVAFEGAAFTPVWVSKLHVRGVAIKAAFVGFTDHSHADKIIAHAKERPHDWINEWLEQERGDTTKLREWAARRAEQCLELKAEAEKYGYPFFDISAMPFQDYLAAVVGYFLQDGVSTS